MARAFPQRLKDFLEQIEDKERVYLGDILQGLGLDRTRATELQVVWILRFLGYRKKRDSGASPRRWYYTPAAA